MARLAIFTADDATWSFAAWRRTLPALARAHEIVGVWVFPDRLGPHTGSAIPRWYLRTFGWWATTLLAAYALRVRIAQLARGPRTWRALARAHGVALHRAPTPNEDAVAAWVRAERIDVVFLTVGNVLRESILSAPEIGTINKHAAMLPSCRGLFPYLWAHVEGAPTGVTFHEVVREIDAGRELLQEELPRASSMLSFYRQVFDVFPALAVRAVACLCRGEFVAPRAGIAPSYHGLPTRADVRAAGVTIATLRDICA